MKSFFAGLAALTIVAIAILVIRGDGLIPSNDPTPSPSSTTNNWDTAPETDPSPTPSNYKYDETTYDYDNSGATTTKGGLTLGESTTPTEFTESTESTTYTTTSKKTITTLNILSSADCLLDAETSVRDLSRDYELNYSLTDDYSATITIWKDNGEEVMPKTLISGSGHLLTLRADTNYKIQTVSESCTETSETWLNLTGK